MMLTYANIRFNNNNNKAKITEALGLSRSTPRDQKSLRAALLKWASALPAVSYLLACANEGTFFGHNPVWELLRGTGGGTLGMDLGTFIICKKRENPLRKGREDYLP